MKILVLGTRQAVEVARFIHSQRPDCHVRGVEWLELYRAEQVDVFRRSIGSYDIVLAQPNESAEYNSLADKIIERLAKKIVFFPIVLHTGFHPDCIVIAGSPQSPVGEYTSLIAASAFNMGLDAERTEALFSARIYQSLGYFDEMGLANAHLDERGIALGFDFKSQRRQWEKAGVFMHTIDHPRGHVLADLTRELMERAGLASLSPYPMLSRSVLDDGPIWPFYPELAEETGISGSLIFQTARNRLGVRRELSLRTFITETFESYQRAGWTPSGDPRVTAASAILRSGLVPDQ